jgi:predicted secreted protein
VLKKTLSSWSLLLMLLVSSTYLTCAAGPPTPTPTPPNPGSGPAPLEISIVVHPNGTWEGEAHLSLVSLSPSSSDLEEALDAQVQREAAAIFGGRGIHYARRKSRDSYTFALTGEDAREIVETALDAGIVTERLAGAVALNLTGAVREGQTLAITLPGNPSTGYSWDAKVPDGNVLSQLGDVETHYVSKGLGVPTRHVIRLNALETGQTNFRLTYRRPWLADLPPTLVISVQPDGLDLAETCEILSLPLPPAAPAFGSQEKGKSKEPEEDSMLSSVQALPNAYNWCDTHGGCPPVRDQGACGSCWAFGTVGPLEAWIKYGDNTESIDLSEQYLLSCNTDGWDCDGGWWAHDYHLDYKPPSESQAGAVLESGFPYVAADVPCSGGYSHPYRINSWAFVGHEESIPSVAAIKQAIYDHGPVATAICTGYYFDHYTGGVLQNSDTCPGDYGGVNHAIVLVGWDDSEQAWTLRNSWSSSWGEDGYMRIRYGTSNVGYSANYVVVQRSFVASDWAYLPLVMQGAGSADYTLANGDFESGHDGSWSESSSNGWSLIVDTSVLPVSPHGGSWAAWLGGDYDETAILSQQVAIPANGTTLNYWYWSASQDFCGWDYAYVRFGSTNLSSYELCDSNDTGGWVSQQINVASWQGQTVELRFVVETDGSLNSNFFLDDVSISTTTAPYDPSVSPTPSEASAAHATAPKRSR